jgi:hypothetical protein
MPMLYRRLHKIEQVNADLKSSALAHIPSGIFAANAAWLVLAVTAFNLTRAAAATADTGLTRATTATIRRKLINIPARIASSARRITLHLPENWPWETGWTHLFDHAFTRPARPLPDPPTQPPARPGTTVEHHEQRGSPLKHALARRSPSRQKRTPRLSRSVD